MSWKKYFTPVDTSNQSGSMSPLGGQGRPGPARTNYSSYLPDVYAGSPNRIESIFNTTQWIWTVKLTLH